MKHIKILLLFLSIHEICIPQTLHAKKQVQQILYDNELLDIFSPNKKTYAVLGTSPGCPWCNKIKPIFQELQQKFPHISFIEVNGSNLPLHVHAKKQNIGIKGYPTILFVKNGKIVDMQVGYTSKNKIEEKLKQL